MPTTRQLVVLRFVAWHAHEHGCPPTFREIVDHMGTASTNGANDHVKALIRKGLLVKRPNLSRSLMLTDRGLTVLEATEHVEAPARV